jgi:cyclohexa-1,5-dienecarbonyl-CoA hydratase
MPELLSIPASLAKLQLATEFSEASRAGKPWRNSRPIQLSRGVREMPTQSSGFCGILSLLTKLPATQRNTFMTQEFSSIACEIRDSVAKITLNQPPLNILDIPMIEEISAALTRIQSNGGAKILALGHEGKAFSAGVSIKDHAPDKVAEMLEKFHGMFRLLDSLSVPTLALVDGMALGGGCELAVYCDIVIASDRAIFGQPEIKVGVFPPVAAVLFPQLIGRNRTLELLLTGETIDAAEAKAMGLVNKVFPAQNFHEQAGEFIKTLVSLSGPVLKLTKRAVDIGLRGTMGERIKDAERIYLNELMRTEDAREGLDSFLEKRKPNWKEK